MTPEQLMQARYKVIGDYPGNNFKVGDILPRDFKVEGATLTPHMVAFYDKYPNLFKPLDWWEERGPEDMPEYVIWEKELYAFKIIHINKERKTAEWNQQGYGPPLSECRPISKEEYEAYHQQNTKV